MSPVNSYKIDKITYFELKSQTTVFPEKAFFVTYESTQAIRALSLSSKIFQMSLCEPELILTSYTALKITGGFKAEPDLPIGYVGSSLGSQDPRGPPATCGPHRVNCRYMICSINIRKNFVVIILFTKFSFIHLIQLCPTRSQHVAQSKLFCGPV